MSAVFTDALPTHLGWVDWLRRELGPSHDRKVRTLILIWRCSLRDHFDESAGTAARHFRIHGLFHLEGN